MAVGAAAGGIALGNSQRAGLTAAGALSLARALPEPPKPAFTPGRPRLLTAAKVSLWAPVMHATVARRQPNADAAPVATLATETPEGTTNLVVIVDQRRVDRRLWLRVRLPVLPNNTLAWVPRTALGGYQFVHMHLVVDLERLSATLFQDGRAVFSAPVGVGRTYWPTPKGEFYVRDELRGYASPFYGPLAFGTSARSAVLTDWPNGGFVGIHGTDEPQLIPGRISHGCIRLRNADILQLSRLMPIGTPVTIR